MSLSEHDLEMCDASKPNSEPTEQLDNLASKFDSNAEWITKKYLKAPSTLNQPQRDMERGNRSNATRALTSYSDPMIRTRLLCMAIRFTYALWSLAINPFIHHYEPLEQVPWPVSVVLAQLCSSLTCKAYSRRQWCQQSLSQAIRQVNWHGATYHRISSNGALCLTQWAPVQTWSSPG
jgi:hypothetical protein